MSNSKDIRKQIRNVLQAEMEVILKQETAEAISKELKAHIDTRLNAIAKHLKDTLDAIEERTKDVQAYMLRNGK